MARRKKGTEPVEEKGFQPVEPLDPSYGAFTVPSYPYGAKSPKAADSPAERPPVLLNGIPIEFIPPWQPTPPTDPPIERQGNGTEGVEAKPSIGTQAEDAAAITSEPQATETSAVNKGDTLPASTPAVAADDAAPRTRDGPPQYASVIGRLTAEGRWKDIAPIRDAMVSEAKGKGLHINAAREWAYAELDRLYPPILKVEPPPAPEIPTSEPPADAVPGLYSIPESWPQLPDNATLQAELGWVQSQRLAVVEERGNAVVVRLERASSPAPSKAALGWLETSIRSYAKYVEVTAKILAGAADEQESVRRERMRLDDIRALLDEMHKAE